jgi:hypothetical protein
VTGISAEIKLTVALVGNQTHPAKVDHQLEESLGRPDERESAKDGSQA